MWSDPKRGRRVLFDHVRDVTVHPRKILISTGGRALVVALDVANAFKHVSLESDTSGPQASRGPGVPVEDGRGVPRKPLRRAQRE